MGPWPIAGIIEFVVALRVGLGVRYRLHAALQLNQDDVHSRRRLAVGAVVHDAGDGARRSASRGQ